jgi:hypothetical protein
MGEERGNEKCVQNFDQEIYSKKTTLEAGVDESECEFNSI